MAKDDIFEEYLRFFLTHYDNYLDVSIGLDDTKLYINEFTDFKKKIKDNRVDFSEPERIIADSELFIKYLELENIEFIKNLE